MAVVSIAVVSIVGLLSGALLNFSSSLQASVGSQIHDQVIHDVQQMAWTNNGSGVYTPPVPAAPYNVTNYFDASGSLLTNLPNGSGPATTVYQVLVQSTNSVFLPGTSTTYQFNDGISPSVIKIQTAIYHYPGATTTPLSWYTDYVSRN